MLKQIAKHSLLAASISTLIACGGGGGGGNDDGATPTPTPTPINGRAIDGPLAGSEVTFSSCTTVATTNATGHYTAPAACANGSIAVTGGVDTATDLPFTGTLKAPKGATVVTPITTIINVLGADKAANIATLLGLPAGTNLLTADPTNNQALYAKTVAVQQLILEIEKTIASLGGNVDAEALNAAAFAAVAQSLANAPQGTPISLSNPSLISSALKTALNTPAVKNNLPAHITDNAIENLAALAANSISANVNKVETAITSMTNFVAGSDNSAAIKTATKTAIVAANTSIAAEKLIASLGDLITLAPEKLATLITLINSGATATEIAAAADTIATDNGVSFDKDAFEQAISAPDAFYSDYLKLNSLTAAGTTYSIAQLLGATTPTVSATAFNDLAVNITAVGTKLAGTSQEVAAALSVDSTKEDVTLAVSKVNLSFNAAGVLTDAKIPAGATLTFVSTSRDLSINTTSELGIYSNNSLALNISNLTQLVPNHLKGQIAGLLPTGATTVTAVITPKGSIPVAYEISKLTAAPKTTLTLLNNQVTGYSLKSSFNVSP